MVKLEEKLDDHQSHLESASKISWQSIQYLPRYFYLDHYDGQIELLTNIAIPSVPEFPEGKQTSVKLFNLMMNFNKILWW